MTPSQALAVIETRNALVKAGAAPASLVLEPIKDEPQKLLTLSKAYKPSHGGYPGEPRVH